MARVEHADWLWPVHPEFHADLRGGPNTFKRSGTEFNEVRGEAKGRAFEWCQDRGMHTSFTRSLKGYPDTHAFKLVRFWCHRMQYIRDNELGRDTSWALNAAGDYEPPEEITAALREVGPAHKTAKAMHDIEKLV